MFYETKSGFFANKFELKNKELPIKMALLINYMALKNNKKCD